MSNKKWKARTSDWGIVAREVGMSWFCTKETDIPEAMGEITIFFMREIMKKQKKGRVVIRIENDGEVFIDAPKTEKSVK